MLGRTLLAALLGLSNTTAPPLPFLTAPAGRSRGKGRGSVNRNYAEYRSKYLPHQGGQETARRKARRAKCQN